MTTTTALIDKLTRILIAALALTYLGPVSFDLTTNILTMHLILITALCIALPSCEVVAAIVIFILFRNLGMGLNIITIKTTMFDIQSLKLANEISFIMPVIVFGIIKKFRKGNNLFLYAFKGIIISWILFSISTTLIYVSIVKGDWNLIAKVFQYNFARNILIYILAGVSLTISMPYVWRSVNNKYKNFRQLTKK